MTDSAHASPLASPLPRWRTARFWVLTVATWAMVALTFSLGRWQMSRADYKLELTLAVAARGQEPALSVSALIGSTDLPAQLHRRVALQGEWLSAHTVYLDNRPMQGRTGFWVLTPLKLAGSSRVVLVQRGWVPRDFADRSRLVPVVTAEGTAEVLGRMALSPGKLYEFKGEEQGRIRQNLRLDAFRTETGLDLLSALVVQTGEPSEGLLRQWDAPNTGVDKHHGYAFQWFALSALLVGLYGWFQVLAPLFLRRKNKRSPD
jgi:surfeit locus 1 family protein